MAVSDRSAVALTEHVGRAAHDSKDQPSSRERRSGLAVSATPASESKSELHVPGQLIPFGLLTTRPAPPLPMIVMDTLDSTTNLAPVVFAESIVTAQSGVPVQAPVQPAKRGRPRLPISASG